MALFVVLVVIACAVVLFAVALRIGAAITRMAVGITNAILGGRDLVEDDFRHRASAYEAIPRPKSLGGIRIPMPGVGYAILVNIVCAIAGAVCQFGASAVAVMAFGMAAPTVSDPNDPAAVTAALSAALGVLLVSLGGHLFGTLVVLKMALPTTFVRATVVVFWQYVITVVILAVIGGGLYALGAAGGGGMSMPSQLGSGGWVR